MRGRHSPHVSRREWTCSRAKIAVNGRYLTVLGVIDSNRALIETSSPSSGSVIRPVGDEAFVHESHSPTCLAAFTTNTNGAMRCRPAFYLYPTPLMLGVRVLLAA